MLLNASRRCRMTDREIGVPGGRMAAKSTDRNVCATGGEARRRFGDAWSVYFSFLKGIKTGGEASASTSQTWRFRK